MKFICLLFSLSFYTISSSQTCILLKKTKDAIYVGAESRFVRYVYSYNNKPQRDTGSMCKIFSEGKYNFALSGYGLEESLGYVRKACKKGGDFWTVMDNYQKSFNGWIGERVNILQKIMPPDSFILFVSRMAPSVLFFGINADSLFSGLVDFSIEGYLNGNFEINFSVSTVEMYGLGYTDHIISKTLKEETWRGNIAETMRSLIEIESKKHPYNVGGQINIVKFTKLNGLNWIGGKKPPCN